MAKKKKALPKAQFGRGVGWGDSFKKPTSGSTPKKSKVATRAAAAAAAKKAYLKTLKNINN